MTSATDNRTTELCKLLEERGVEYKTFHRHYKGYRSPDNDYTNWHVYGDGKHISGSFHENDGSVHFSMHAYGVTPEQAIAATLGNEREKALEKLVQYALDEGHIDEWWYEDALKLGLEARY